MSAWLHQFWRRCGKWPLLQELIMALPVTALTVWLALIAAEHIR